MEYGRHILISLAIFFSFTYCEVIKTTKCYVPRGQMPNCTVHDIQINPCPEAAENKPCKIKLGSNVSLSFKYTPTWSATKVGSQAYKAGGMLDIGFEHMDTNGCLYTTCPVEADKEQHYTFSLSVDKQLPATIHQVRWKLWNDEDYHQQCCFNFPLNLVN